MTFTDEDLKRLKEDNPAVRPHPEGSCRDSRSGIFCRQCELAISDQAKEMNALLARLEAAEKPCERARHVLCHVAQLLDGWHTDVAWTEWDESVRKAVSELMSDIEAWRKAAGK